MLTSAARSSMEISTFTRLCVCMVEAAAAVLSHPEPLLKIYNFFMIGQEQCNGKHYKLSVNLYITDKIKKTYLCSCIVDLL